MTVKDRIEQLENEIKYKSELNDKMNNYAEFEKHIELDKLYK